jgi:hypothetical protein
LAAERRIGGAGIARLLPDEANCRRLSDFLDYLYLWITQEGDNCLCMISVCILRIARLRSAIA